MNTSFNTIVTNGLNTFEPILTPMANILGHNKRYIKLDGSSYQTNGFQAIMEKDHFRSGFIAALALIGFQAKQLGISDVFSWEMLKYTSTAIGIAGASLTLLELADRHAKSTCNDVIIDRTGNRLNMQNGGNKEIEVFQQMRNKGLKLMSFTSLVTGYFAIEGIEPKYDIPPEISLIPVAMIMARGASWTYRYQMLINGYTSDKKGYVITKKPIETKNLSDREKQLKPAIT